MIIKGYIQVEKAVYNNHRLRRKINIYTAGLRMLRNKSVKKRMETLSPDWGAHLLHPDAD
jgi:hypothetical protein